MPTTTKDLYTTSIHPTTGQEINNGWLLAPVTVLPWADPDPVEGGFHDGERVRLKIDAQDGYCTVEETTALAWRDAGIPLEQP